MKLLSDILDQNKYNFYDDIKIMYYTCLNIWILSYHKESYEWFHNEEYGLFCLFIYIVS